MTSHIDERVQPHITFVLNIFITNNHNVHVLSTCCYNMNLGVKQGLESIIQINITLSLVQRIVFLLTKSVLMTLNRMFILHTGASLCLVGLTSDSTGHRRHPGRWLPPD